MITKTEAAAIYDRKSRHVWHGEAFADAVVRMDKDIRDCAESAMGVSGCYNPTHVPALIAILHQYGFTDAKVNHLDNFRIEIHWK